MNPQDLLERLRVLVKGLAPLEQEEASKALDQLEQHLSDLDEQMGCLSMGPNW